ncbi:tripartite tricarboxylate transporter substrate binding protein [Variovorax sp. J22P168]|uniref:Bug family tripartite tricarboxylate transporter substrate binding protein n=1 Tax=Variovorax jilinensis TaxID=3053513 RepID=UPI0025781CF4|nr:tripartite tricarboxylate transporter substrate binding protein [Variovorax sp. J22P168]MDM0015168.1 tripartite tricarboxylate transporter substrate binding protein [Variovorax sp. J22P168]
MKSNLNRRMAVRALAALSVGGLLAPALAQGFPSKPIRLIVPFVPGGPTDGFARVFGQDLGAALGQPVVVENKPGAGGNIGTDAVAKAAPDGYTVGIGVNGPLAANLQLMGKLPYDPVKDFTAVSLLFQAPNALVVRADFPAKNLAEMLKLIRAKPGEMAYGTGGPGSSSNFSGELLNTIAGVKTNAVPYKGDGPALVDVLGGQIPMAFLSLGTTAEQIKAGKLRALAVTSAQRVPLFPDVPTMQEAGLPGYEITAWYGLIAPAGLPAAVTERLNAATVKIMNSPEMKAKIASMGGFVSTGTSKEFHSFILSEIPKWSKLAQDSGIKLN